MPHINPYEAATDEPKTYQDELIRDDSNDLSDIKGDLVAENDQDVQRSYEVCYYFHEYFFVFYFICFTVFNKFCCVSRSF